MPQYVGPTVLIRWNGSNSLFFAGTEVRYSADEDVGHKKHIHRIARRPALTFFSLIQNEKLG